MRRFFDRDDDFSDLESELRDGRPEPRPELLHELVARVGTDTVAGAEATAARRAGGSPSPPSSSSSSPRSAASATRRRPSSPRRRAPATSSPRSRATASRAPDRTRAPGTANGARESNGNAGTSGGNHHGGGGEDPGEWPPWGHQYSRFVLVCYPFQIHGNDRSFHTIIVPRWLLSYFVPPGTVGPCGFPP